MEGGGMKAVQDLQPGERVLASSESDGSGELVFSEVLTFLDRDPSARKYFVVIGAEGGATLSLTPAHLLFVTEGNCSGMAVRRMLRTVFASDARPGQCVLTTDVGEEGGKGRLSLITWVRLQEDRGVYAPLTQHGTLVVNGVLASCYAAMDQNRLAHWAFAPLRLLYRWTGTSCPQSQGIHWYSRVLYWMGTWLLDAEHFHPWGVVNSER